MEVRRETLHGHAARLPLELVGADHIDLVNGRRGRLLYDDDSWALAVLNAARQLAPDGGIDETEFWSIYDAHRQAQGGSLSRAVATRYFDVVVHPEQVDLTKTPSPRMWKRALEGPVSKPTEPDAIVTTFSGVPNALVAISPSRTPTTTA